MKVLQVVNWYGSAGGVETYVYDIAGAMEARGIGNTVFYAHPGLDLFSVPGRREYQIPQLLSFVGKPKPQTMAGVERLLEQEAPDVMYLHTMVNPHLAHLLLDRLPTVFFNHNHTVYCPGGMKLFQQGDALCPIDFGPRCLVSAYLKACNTRRPWLLWATYRWSTECWSWLRRVASVIVDTVYVANALRRAGLSQVPIAVLPSPVPVPAREELEPAGDGRTLLFAGRLTPEKGLKYLLLALGRVQAPWRLLVAGVGYQQGELQRLAHRLGLSDRVQFLGWTERQKLAELYRRCTAVVLPSVWPEPYGKVGPEAMAYGKPVVAFRVGGIPEWLEDGETGFLVPHKDVSALAERLETLLSHQELCLRMGRRARERAEERFTIQGHLDNILTLLQAAMERRGAKEPVPAPITAGAGAQAEP